MVKAHAIQFNMPNGKEQLDKFLKWVRENVPEDQCDDATLRSLNQTPFIAGYIAAVMGIAEAWRGVDDTHDLPQPVIVKIMELLLKNCMEHNGRIWEAMAEEEEGVC